MLLINQHIAKYHCPFNLEGKAFDFDFGAGKKGMRDFHGSEYLMGNFPQVK